MTWPAGERYEGTWKNDKFDGHGVLTRPDGSQYESKANKDPCLALNK